jgi:hypothetical protein
VKPFASCETGTLVLGRGTGGREPNASNTLAGSCADGDVGPARQRWNAVDSIKVSSADGSSLAEGGAAHIDAAVWITTPGEDVVDVFHAADALSPNWTLIATQVPRNAGSQEVSVAYVLPAGAQQAVRVQLRQGRAAEPCAPGDVNDRDDLVFGVAGSTR